MARGLDRHKLRQQQCLGMGKELSRRAKSKCELCATKSSLKVIELLPLTEEPELNWAILVCSECQPLLREKLSITDTTQLQFLHETIWSEIIPVQVTSIRLVKHLTKMQVPWVQGLLDSVYIDPTIEPKI
jgi:protein PhnA